MQDFLVYLPPQATSCRPLSTTERVWLALPWEENRRMRRMRGYLVQEKEGWCRLVLVVVVDASDCRRILSGSAFINSSLLHYTAKGRLLHEDNIEH